MDNNISTGVSVLLGALGILSFMNLGFVIKSQNYLDMTKTDPNATNITELTNSSECINQLYKYIEPINISTAAIPFLIGFMIIIAIFLRVFYKQSGGAFQCDSNLFLATMVICFVLVVFSFSIGWPFLVPILMGLYWYGFAVLLICAGNLEFDSYWFIVFNDLKMNCLACACISTFAILIILIMIPLGLISQRTRSS